MPKDKRDRDDDEVVKKGRRDPEEDAADLVSLDPDDAVDVGLFSSGPATIAESIFTEYDYGGNLRGRPPLVWLITFERGTGKEKEQYEQPYTLGKGWALTKSGRLRNVGQTTNKGLARSCNAMRHLLVPLKTALDKAGIDDLGILTRNQPALLEGLVCEVERVEQEVRNIADNRPPRSRDEDERGPRTILEIRTVHAVPWDTPGRTVQPKEKPAVSKSRRSASEDEGAPGQPTRKVSPDENGDLQEEAVEALIDAMETGPIAISDLEPRLRKVLRGVEDADDIIDLATSQKFLKSERGWSYDGKIIDVEG